MPNWIVKVNWGPNLSQRLIAAVAAIVALAVPFLVIYVYILNHFYDQGAFFWDSGWFADLMWHKPWSLPNSKVGREQQLND